MSEMILKAIGDLQAGLDAKLAASNEQVKAIGKVSDDVTNEIKNMTVQHAALQERLQAIESRKTAGEDDTPMSLGQKMMASDGFKAMLAGSQRTAALRVKSITNLPASAGQIIVPQYTGMLPTPQENLTIRNYIATGRCNSSTMIFFKENVFTNNAGYQVAQGDVKPVSDDTFVQQQANAVTIAHTIDVSKQILNDAPMLMSYLENRMIYGLKLKEEREILKGAGTAGTLQGLWTAKTAYTPTVSENKIDAIRRAAQQVSNGLLFATAVLLHPSAWAEIQLLKDTQGRYLIGNPASGIDSVNQTIWGLPVIQTFSIAVDEFMVCNLTMATMLWDLEQANIVISSENKDNIERNMVTIRAEESLMLTNYRPAGLIGGTLP